MRELGLLQPYAARCSSSFEDGQISLIPEGFLPVSAHVPRSAVDHPELAVGREGLQELPGLAELVLAPWFLLWQCKAGCLTPEL